MNLANKFIASVLLFSTSICIAEPTVYLKAKDPAPFNGILFSLPKAEETRIKLLERDSFEKMNKMLEKSIIDLEQIKERQSKNFNLLLDETDDLAKNLYSERQMKNVERLMWFGGGAAVVVLIVWGLRSFVK